MNDEAAVTENRWSVLLPLLAFMSGMASVVYEVLYLRSLTTILGDMFYVHAALLCVFILGLGVGAKLAFRFPRYLYAFELTIGAYAFLLPFIASMYEGSLLGALFSDPATYTVFSAVLLLGLPAVAIGFSVPLFTAYIKRYHRSQDAFGAAYFLYNMGAFLSILIADFYLVRVLGFTRSLYVVGALNLTCGFVLLANRSKWSLRGYVEEVRTPLIFASKTTLSLFLASFSAAVYQSFFIAVYYNMFGPHRENFALCTSAVLLAIALGTALVSRYRIRYQSCLLFSTVLIAGTTLCIPLMGFIYRHFSQIQEMYVQGAVLQGGGADLDRAFQLLFAFLLGGVPFLALGGMIPALLLDDESPTRSSGQLLFVSGVANAIGILLYVFVLHPNLSFFAIPALTCGLLLFSTLVFDEGFSVFLHWKVALIALVMTAAVLGLPEEVNYLGYKKYRDVRAVNVFKSAADSVTHVRRGDQTFLRYNGHPSIIVRRGQRINAAELLSGVLPALVSPRHESALVLGLGSGITGGTAARLFSRTEIVEINQAFIDLARINPSVNFSVMNNSSAHVYHDDARRMLATTDRKYDVIVNSIPSPTFYSAGKIYTVEFFDMVKRALADGGVYCTWLATGNMSPRGIVTLLASLESRFRSCGLFILRGQYYFATCSDTETVPRSISTLNLPDDVAAALHLEIDYVTLDRYFSSIFISRNVFGSTSFKDIALNRDDFPVLEFHIMSYDKSKSNSFHPIYENPLKYNIVLPRGRGAAEFIEISKVYRRVAKRFFHRDYEPILRRAGQLYRDMRDQEGGGEEDEWRNVE